MSSNKTIGKVQLVIAIGLGLFFLSYSYRLVAWFGFMVLVIATLLALAGISRLTKDKSTNSNLKPCPFCAESIHATALKCRFCGSELPQDLREP